MKIERRLSIRHDTDSADEPNDDDGLSGDERVSLLDELRYDLGEITGFDYSRRFERSLSVIRREPR